MIMPKGQTTIRQFEVSRRLIQSIIAVGFAFFLLLIISASGWIYYQKAYYQTEDIRIAAAHFAHEKESYMQKIAQLKKSLNRVARIALYMNNDNAKKLADNTKNTISSGFGPIEESDWLPISGDSLQAGSSMSLGMGEWEFPFDSHTSHRLHVNLDDLSEKVSLLEMNINSVFTNNRKSLVLFEAVPSIWPSSGEITSSYGERRHTHVHQGIDIASSRGTPIIAPGYGVVAFVGYRNGYGKTIMIDHGYGISTLYAHCSKFFVTRGQAVNRGMKIAAVGNTGRSTGPHLHYEVQFDGVPVDPRLYITGDFPVN